MHTGTRVGALNTRVQERSSPGQEGLAEARGGGQVYRPGDRVLQLKNDYGLEVFNGDLGTVRGIEPIEQEMIVALDDGREIHYPFASLHQLTHAYAISVHKAQGAEFLAVVILLLTSHAAILGRTLLYTAVTRAQRLVVIVGQQQALALAVRDWQRTRDTRHSPGSSAERSAIPGPASPRRCWRRSVRCRCRRRGKDCSGKQQPDHPEGTLRSSDGPLEPFQDRHHPFAGRGDPDLDGRAHATRSIDYRQDPESPPVDQAVGQEIHAPPLLRTLCWQWRTRGASSAFAGIAICGHCGGALHFHSDWNGRARVYCYQERQVKRCGWRSSFLDGIEAQIAACQERSGCRRDGRRIVAFYEQARNQRDDADIRRREIEVGCSRLPSFTNGAT